VGKGGEDCETEKGTITIPGKTCYQNHQKEKNQRLKGSGESKWKKRDNLRKGSGTGRFLK